MSIGFFDSGIGGVTVLSEALKVFPKEDFLYYADTKNVPYGPKPATEVKGFIINAVDFLAEQGISALVVACNTATSVAIEALRERYSFPVIGMEPAIKPAVETIEPGKRVLALATALTLKGEKFQNLAARVDPDGIVDPLPMPELVKLAEGFEFSPEVVIPCLKVNFAPYDLDKVGAIVLGCTHFAFFKDSLRKVLPDTKIIDGTSGTLRQLQRKLSEIGYLFDQGNGNITFYSSAGETDLGRVQKAFSFAIERV